MLNLSKLNTGSARSFWAILKSVSVGEIADEARRPFAIAIVGSPEKRAAALHFLFPGEPEESVRPLLRSFDSTSEADGFPQEPGEFDIVIDAGGGRSQDSRPGALYSVEEIGTWDLVASRMLEDRPDLALSMARRFPGLRARVADRTIRDYAVANAQFTMLNALPGVIPLLGLLLPTVAVGDMVILAKNQAMMLFRLAAIYDLPLDLKTRAKDLAPLLGNAFGWRAIAREITGFVPGGVGLAARGVIAYAGTVALGKALHLLYSTGEKPTRAQVKKYYHDSLEAGKKTAATIADKLLNRRKPPRIGS